MQHFSSFVKLLVVRTGINMAYKTRASQLSLLKDKHVTCIYQFYARNTQILVICSTAVQVMGCLSH